MAVKHGITLTFVFLTVLNFPVGFAQILITTSVGNVSGTTVAGKVLTNFSYQTFVNIPYALPPRSSLRFKAPVAYSAVNKTLIINTKIGTVMCPQTVAGNLVGDEDCLILNVYSPVGSNSSSAYPVMVYIHGGYFIRGFSAFYQPEFLVSESVVLVTVNYRLGALGFLSLGDERAPGNAGLKDQTLALKWVKNEIQNFGGNNELITLFGESAGAASVHHHICSSYSSGLFQQAITQSGSALANWAYMETGYVDKATSLAQTLGCVTNNVVNFTCLQDAPASDIIINQDLPVDKQGEYQGAIVSFFPVKETNITGAFHSDSMANIIKTVANPVRTIMGINKDEGLLTIRQSDVFFQNFLGNLKYFIPTEVVSKLSDAEINARADKIKAMYFTNTRPPTIYNYQKYVDLYTDEMFAVPALQAAQSLLAQNATVYMYRFNYDGAFKLTVLDAFKFGISGVNHGDELGYLFYITRAVQSTSFTESYDVLRKMVTMWTTFAKTGNPIPGLMDSNSTLYNVTWDPIMSNITKHLAITATPVMVSANFCDTSMAEMWNEVTAQPLSGCFLFQPMVVLIAISIIATQIFSCM